MSNELAEAKKFISWMHTKAQLDSLSKNAAKRFVKRGQVYWCHFGLNIGSEMSKADPRPAIVVSNFKTNKNSPNIIVVPVTHNNSQLPYLVPLMPITKEDGSIILDGQANTASIICVSKARLGDLIASLSPTQMKNIDKSISISLDLLHYYADEAEKYNKLTRHLEQVKTERNKAQDTLKKIREIISKEHIDAKSQEKIKEILDI